MGISSNEHGLGDPLWSVILGSSRESDSYRKALSAILSSDREQKLLYTLSDNSAIEGMLNALDLESQLSSSKLKSKRERRKAFVLLKRMCRAHAKLPSSYVIEGGLEREGSHACALGGAADVWKGRYCGKLVAIKSLRICCPQGNGEGNAGNGIRNVDQGVRRLKQKFCHEAVIWKRLSHPNLLPFLGVNETLFTLAMISEWMEHGTILQFVKQHKTTNRLKLLHDVASGLDYLHDLPFVHSDIKSANILINNDLSACIGDFGLTNITSTASISMVLSAPLSGGTCRWMAPELIKSDDAGGAPRKPSKESDVYAFAMMAYEIFAHCVPFRHLNSDYLVILDVIAGNRPARPPHREVLGLDDSVWDIIQGCWDSDPQVRPTIKGVRGFLGPASRRWTPPTTEAIDAFDFDSSAATTIDSTTGDSTPSEDFLGSARLRAYISNTTISSGDDRYVDFTSYSDGTDPYHPHSGTEESVGNPSGTRASSEEEESLRNAIRRERELASLRTREWVQAQQLGSLPEASPRRPGVTFEENLIIHIVPQPSSESLSDEPDKIQVDPVPPPPSETRADGSGGEIPNVRVTTTSSSETRATSSDEHFEILTRPARFPPSDDSNRHHQPTDAGNHHNDPAGSGMYAPRIDPIPLPNLRSPGHRLGPSNTTNRSGVQGCNMALPPPPIIFAT